MQLKFLTVFLLTAFVMKVVGEAVHEVMGHGLFVLLFGGRITTVHISALWPYELYAEPSLHRLFFSHWKTR